MPADLSEQSVLKLILFKNGLLGFIQQQQYKVSRQNSS